MEQSEKAKQFLASLDQDQLQVGDGLNHLPVWIGIDAEAGRVYKVYANGIARGFGDGRMTIISGCGDQMDQSTQGSHVTMTSDARMKFYECDPHPVLKMLAQREALCEHGWPATPAITP